MNGYFVLHIGPFSKCSFRPSSGPRQREVSVFGHRCKSSSLEFVNIFSFYCGYVLRYDYSFHLCYLASVDALIDGNRIPYPLRPFPFSYCQSVCPVVSSVLSLSEEYAQSLHPLVLSSATGLTAGLRLSSVLSLSEKFSTSLHSFVVSSAVTGLIAELWFSELM